MAFRTESICRNLFSPLVCDGQCCEVKEPFCYNFWRTTIANEKQSLKVSLSRVVFCLEKLLYFSGPGLDGIEGVSMK